jgi:hypothetical protein
MRRVALISVVLLAGCASVDPGGLDDATRAPAASGPVFARADLESDLELALAPTDADPLTAERLTEDTALFRVTLVNHSASRAYGVIVPRDGSDRGLRDPHTWFTVLKSSDGEDWETPRVPPYASCGVYDNEWEDDVVVLEPGARLKLADFPFYALGWELGGATLLRVTAHYSIGKVLRDRSKIPPALHRTPPFELASNEVRVAIGPLPPGFPWPASPSTDAESATP